jgi:hypothetical protein
MKITNKLHYIVFLEASQVGQVGPARCQCTWSVSEESSRQNALTKCDVFKYSVRKI